jgi:Zn-dependent protease
MSESVLVAVSWALVVGVLLNLSLACFNLLPVFPLDGEKVIVGLIPGRWVRTALRVRNYGMVVLFFLLASGPVFGYSIFGWLVDWVIYPLFRFLVPPGFEGYY